jgi:hypothetical protein
VFEVATLGVSDFFRIVRRSRGGIVGSFDSADADRQRVSGDERALDPAEVLVADESFDCE